ncbi:hypothetical protein [Xenorhabdus lircayensis]|uniref:DUF4105 domain-containing protein n=1 Tax=Xenorhabdus lircayensis TaxID=2763499 RepID=A0ABS0U6P9_9GAMM|nr:hypothetical protein [Xenorhabdus lircayensis]MBI6549559.1 hypothetical protein [Xenorhabdus lircayensis]
MYNGKMYGNLRFAPTYNVIYKNCSTVVAKILKSGGVGSLLNPIQRIGYAKNIYWTPKDIAQYCVFFSGLASFNSLPAIFVHGFKIVLNQTYTHHSPSLIRLFFSLSLKTTFLVLMTSKNTR